MLIKTHSKIHILKRCGNVHTGSELKQPISDTGRNDQPFYKKMHILLCWEIHKSYVLSWPQKWVFCSLLSFSFISLEKYAIISFNNSEYYFLSTCMSIPAFRILNLIHSFLGQWLPQFISVLCETALPYVMIVYSLGNTSEVMWSANIIYIVRHTPLRTK